MELDKISSLPRGTLLNIEDYKKIASSIELNPIATEAVISSLKQVPKGEPPMDLIFAIKYEDSLNNRRYTTKAYQSIVQQILSTDVFIPVCFGHQNPEVAHFDARKIVGSVIGAHLDERGGIIYYRIIPDASESNADIRRWLRNKQINALSIWGYAVSENVEDGIEVIDDFILLSVDLVPPLTEGQENIGLIISESRRLALYPKGENNKNITNIDKTNNIEEGNMPNNEINLKELTNLQLTGEIACRLREGRMSLKMALGEMDGTGVASEEDLHSKEALVQDLQKEVADLLQKVKDAGFKDFEELLNYAIEAKKVAQEMQEKADFEKIKGEIMQAKGLIKDGKPTGAMAGFVDKWATLNIGMSRSEMEASIDKVIKDEHFIHLAGESAGAEPRNAGSGDKLDSESSAEEYTI